MSATIPIDTAAKLLAMDNMCLTEQGENAMGKPIDVSDEQSICRAFSMAADSDELYDALRVEKAHWADSLESKESTRLYFQDEYKREVAV